MYHQRSAASPAPLDFLDKNYLPFGHSNPFYLRTLRFGERFLALTFYLFCTGYDRGVRHAWLRSLYPYRLDALAEATQCKNRLGKIIYVCI